MITQVTYERLYNVGNYESLRLSAVASVDLGDIEAAWSEARQAVELEYASFLDNRQSQPEPAPAEYAPPSASQAQRNYIATLQEKLGWSSEELAQFAADHNFDLAMLTKIQASDLIDLLQKEQREEGINRWSARLVTPAEKPGTVGSADIPF